MSVRFGGHIFAALCTLALAGAMLLCDGTASAQSPDKAVDPKVAAKEHYTRGTSFYDLGRYDDAIKEFEAAYQLKNDPAFLYNLAQSYRQAGNHDQAVHFYKTYLRYVPNAKNRADIEEKIKAEEQLAAKGGGTTTTPPPVNTTPPPPTNTTPPPGNTTPPPGTNEPAVTVPPGNTPPPPGYTPPPGYPPPPQPGFPPATTTTSDPGKKFRIAGMATAGAGAVMMVVGIIEWRRAVSASNEVEKAARNGDQFDPAVQQRGHSAETAQKVFYTLGALAIAGGVGLFFYGQHVTAAAETTTWRVSLAPTLTPNQGGATLRINF